MKKILILALMLLICQPSIAVYAEEEADIQILCLGSYLEPDVEPFYADSRIMAPVRAVFEAVGAEVTWDDETKRAVGKKADTEVILTLGSNVITVNGEQRIMDTVLTEKDDRVFAPIRFVAESFGYKVCYHEESETAVISENGEYGFYPSINVPLPRFDSVTGAEVIKEEKNEHGYNTYYYVYDENYVTEYFNTLQSDFGYTVYNITFDGGAHIHEYISAGGHIVKVTDYFTSDGVVCITVTPDEYGDYSALDSAYEPGPPQYMPEEPADSAEPVPEPSAPDATLDYGAVTGSALIDTYKASDGSLVYRYAYNQFVFMQYESYLSSVGWHFYDFDFNLDMFANTTYYSDGNSILSVTASYMLGEVWIIYP